MKRNVIKRTALCFLCSCVITTAFAQIGIKAGVAAADIAFKRYGQTPYLGYEINSLIHEKPMISYQAGFYGRHKLTERWIIQAELLYALMGINYNKKFIYDDIVYRVNISYLQLPLSIGYRIINKEKTFGQVYLGPYVSTKLKAIKKTEVEGLKNSNDVDNVKGLDVGTIVGLSLDRQLPAGKLNFDFRISYSLVDMMDPVEGHLPEYNRTPGNYARNVGIIFSVGYFFDDLLIKSDI